MPRRYMINRSCAVSRVHIITRSKNLFIIFARLRDVYADQFDSVGFGDHTTQKRDNISRPRHGTSPANILAVFATANENKNFLFSFLHQYIHIIQRRAADSFLQYTPNHYTLNPNILPKIRYG